MAAITGIVSKGRLVPWGAPVPGGLYAEVWQIPASTAGDTQTLTSNLLSEILYVNGVPHTAPVNNTVAVTTPNTVAASNFQEFFVIGRTTNP